MFMHAGDDPIANCNNNIIFYTIYNDNDNENNFIKHKDSL